MEGEGVEERDWVMMGAINLGAVLEYGRASGVISPRDGPNFGGGGVRVVVKRATTIVEDDETKMDVDDTGDSKLAAIHASPVSSEVDDTLMAQEYPTSFKLATQLTFSMLSYALKNPTRKASPFARATLNPYLTIALTFLSTISKHPATLQILKRSIPWAELAG